MDTAIIGARDWAGFVKRALVPKTIDERGELETFREKINNHFNDRNNELDCTDSSSM